MYLKFYKVNKLLQPLKHSIITLMYFQYTNTINKEINLIKLIYFLNLFQLIKKIQLNIMELKINNHRIKNIKQ